jgi:hypothetical protein
LIWSAVSAAVLVVSDITSRCVVSPIKLVVAARICVAAACTIAFSVTASVGAGSLATPIIYAVVACIGRTGCIDFLDAGVTVISIADLVSADINGRT